MTTVIQSDLRSGLRRHDRLYDQPTGSIQWRDPAVSTKRCKSTIAAILRIEQGFPANSVKQGGGTNWRGNCSPRERQQIEQHVRPVQEKLCQFPAEALGA